MEDWKGRRERNIQCIFNCHVVFYVCVSSHFLWDFVSNVHTQKDSAIKEVWEKLIYRVTNGVR
jgi:hypothetical protein